MIYKTTTGGFPKKYEIRTRKIRGITVDVSVIVHNLYAEKFGGLVQRSYTLGHYANVETAKETVDSESKK
jgi:hypothetical protein